MVELVKSQQKIRNILFEILTKWWQSIPHQIAIYLLFLKKFNEKHGGHEYAKLDPYELVITLTRP